jgi:4-hydroxybenzoate polyprenyltransferase
MREVTTSTSGSSAPALVVRTVRGLALSCHPIPSVAVTVLVTVLSAVAGNRWLVLALTAGAVLAGQLSIGWSNDLLDADRDAAVRRPDKPIAAGTIARGTVRAATGIAVVATVALSLALGWRAGAVHLVAVASGWAYNAGLKSTVWSIVPYIVTFGLFPAVATLPLPGHPLPPSWVSVAGALIGVSAHFANAAPDLTEDAAAGVRGLPQRLGRTACGVAACAAALAVVVVITLARGMALSPFDWLLAAVAVAVAVVGLVRLRRDPHTEAAFYGSMLIAALAITMIATSGSLSP